MTALEAYYRPGSWLFGTEYFLQKADAPQSGNPLFHGGDAVATRAPGSSSHVFLTSILTIRRCEAARSGGSRRWSTGTCSDHVRLAAAYGYGSLDRFGLVGKTQFFQTRLQLQL